MPVWPSFVSRSCARAMEEEGAPPRWRKKRRRRSPRRGLSWNPIWLTCFAERLFENMGYVAFAMLMQFLDNQVFYWATACSGTESAHWVFQCLSQMDEFDVTLRHIYAAEWEASKRAWILSQTRPTHVFKDIFDITRETAHCFVEGVVINVKTRCHNKTTDMFLAGFSCKTVSALSNDAEQRRASI